MRLTKIFLLCLALASIQIVISQNTINLPYSSFAIGTQYINLNAKNLSMGDLSFGIQSPQMINYKNPASYGAFDSTSFVFEGGGFSRGTSLSTIEKTHNFNQTTLGYLLFGFPAARWLSFSFGILPYSISEYSISYQLVENQAGLIQKNYSGNGGLNAAFIGASVQPIKNLYLGANVSYLWGDLEKTNSITFPDSIFILATRLVNKRRVSDVKFDMGLQYHTSITNDINLTLGVTAGLETELSAKKYFIHETYVPIQSGIDLVRDTIDFTPEEKGNIVLPTEFGFGFSFSKPNKWLFGFDYHYQNWEEYRSFGESEKLTNSNRFSVGGEIIPNSTSISGFFKRLHYRFGMSYLQSNLIINEKRINDFGISFGLGLPMRRAKSMINLGCKVGQIGTTDNNLVKENYFQFTLGLSVYEKWFLKTKYY